MINTIVQEDVKRLDSQLGDQLDEIAMLIGRPQKQETTFNVDGEEYTLAPGLQMDFTHAVKLRRRAIEFRAGSLRLAVIGDFSAGKSTLINALLGARLLPADTAACTCIPIEIVNGTNGNEVTLVKEGYKLETISYEAFKETARFGKNERAKVSTIPTRPNRLKEVEFARLESKSTLCQNGIRLVDTPGLGSDELSTSITKKFIEQADTLLVVTKDTPDLSAATREIVENFVNLKGERGQEHVFFLYNVNSGDWSETAFLEEKEVNEIEKEEAGKFHDNLIHIFKGDESLYNKRAFLVDGLDALLARVSSEHAGKLEASGIQRFEKELLSFMNSRDRVSVVMNNVMKEDLLPAIGVALGHIAGASEALGKEHWKLEKEASQAKRGMSDLRTLADHFKDSAQELVQEIKPEIAHSYRRALESVLADKEFEKYWANANLQTVLETDSDSAAEEAIKNQVEIFMSDRNARAIEMVETEYPLAKQIEEATKTIVDDFFVKLDESTPYTKKGGLFDDADLFKIRTEDVFLPPIDMPSISLTKPVFRAKRWYGNIPSLWLSSGLLHIGRRVKKGWARRRVKRAILKTVTDTRRELSSSDGPVIKSINQTIDQNASVVINTTVERLYEHIKVVEQQWADVTSKMTDKSEEEQKLQKIKHILNAKSGEISQAVLGKVLDWKELKAEFYQTQQIQENP